MNYLLLGAIAGDISGSTYEFMRDKTHIKTYQTNEINLFPEHSQFTDDTVCTCAIADWLMQASNLVSILQDWCCRYRNGRGYGSKFGKWIDSNNPQPYHSWGNGSAMRVNAIGWFASNKEECLDLAKQSAEITHDSEEGIKGAQAIALAVYLAKLGVTAKGWIKQQVLDYFYPKWSSKTIANIKPTYTFDVSCEGSVPVAIICFLESENYEDCLQKVISLGGDSDTIAAMSGGIAYAYYKTMDPITLQKALSYLDNDIINLINQFDLFINYGYNR